jgi:hypothetical protein
MGKDAESIASQPLHYFANFFLMVFLKSILVFEKNNKPKQTRFFYHLTGLCFPTLGSFSQPKTKSSTTTSTTTKETYYCSSFFTF